MVDLPDMGCSYYGNDMEDKRKEEKLVVGGITKYPIFGNNDSDWE